MSTLLFSSIWIGILILLFFLLVHINVNLKKKFKFSTRVIISTVLGFAVGIVFQSTLGMVGAEQVPDVIKNVTTAASLVGRGFTSLLKMVVIPLVGLSVYNSIINSKNNENLKKLTGKSVVYYTVTVAISAIIGISVAMLFNLGVGMKLPEGMEAWTGKGEYKGLVDVVVSFIPSNIFKAMSETSVIGVVIFAAFLGFATNRMSLKNPEKIQPLKDVTSALFAVMTSVTTTIIKIIPYGVAALMFDLTASYGLEVFKNLVTYLIVMFISLALVVVMQSINLAIHGINPFTYYKKAMAPLILALTTTSSMGTLPVTIETLEKEVGVSSPTANFTATLGTTIGMNGCAGVFPAVIAIMIANMNGIAITPVFLISLITVIALGSFGMAGVPGTAYIAATVVLGGMGLPFDPVAIVFPIDSIIDMGRTAVNVNGAMVISTVVDKEMGSFNESVLKSERVIEA
ncbi:MAG: dicarboxylate/amino acid:cation symporter [Leptotrichia sp.]|jgi:L-cystine uptake protein tcyP|nr:dicarboxylate/amino acid:cation symporter [Leptotrichia sp.]